MGDGIRCPHCKKKLLESLNGTAIVFCRHCKHTVTLTGDDVSYADFLKEVAMSHRPVTTRKLDNGLYEYTEYSV